MEERLRFEARLPDGGSMTDVCRAFGISRKTGYKIFNRYKERGLSALTVQAAAIDPDLAQEAWNAIESLPRDQRRAIAGILASIMMPGL